MVWYIAARQQHPKAALQAVAHVNLATACQVPVAVTDAVAAAVHFSDKQCKIQSAAEIV